ncbi:MAG: hypothetical protein KAI86_10555 [Desulfobacterales bacterium]|nr:hypothetical protein [Desulfobacterales bacterium]
MCIQKRIGIVRKIQMESDNEIAVTNKSDTFKLDGRTSSFAAFTNAVFSMNNSSYRSSYSHINDNGGSSYGDCSHMMMISILRSNIGYNNKSKIKPIGTLCFKEALKEIDIKCH